MGRIIAEDGELVTDQIIMGDCVQILKTLPSLSIDLTITDPPYLVNYLDRSNRRIQGDQCGDWLKPVFSEIFRVMKNDSFCISFYGWNMVDLFMQTWKEVGFSPVGHLVWKKDYSSNSKYLAYNHEQAYLLAKGNPVVPGNPLPDVQSWTYSGNKFHPTQKSIHIIEPLIESFSCPGSVVLDPFCGAASTAIAARNTGRHYLAIEKDENYFSIAEKRLKIPHAA